MVKPKIGYLDAGHLSDCLGDHIWLGPKLEGEAKIKEADSN